MLTAQEARARVNMENNLMLKGIQQRIEKSVESASNNLKTSVRVDLSENLEKIGQQQIISQMEKLGYKIEYKTFTPPQWDQGTKSSYYFIISW